MFMAATSRLGPLLLFVLWTMVTVVLPGSGEGGWQQSGLGTAAAVPEERCTVERQAHLTYAEFMQHYAFVKPVILQGLTDNSRFRALCSRENLLASFGDNVVRLSTANTYSYRKVDLPFQEYVEQLLHPQDPTSLGNGEPNLGSIGNGTLRTPLLWVLYFPDRWWHATLNLDTSVFISTFLG
ncbi:hypothetical protein U0070_005354 [Myodes glareolus]|uniref:Jumonji domain containing 8 n=1 Tax=Myodes glareolus TaxID=447135 RepID=A0AAW0HB64_MYOGA